LLLLLLFFFLLLLKVLGNYLYFLKNIVAFANIEIWN
jgi:hypothetical protein